MSSLTTLLKVTEQYQAQYQAQGVMVITDHQPDLKLWITALQPCWSSQFSPSSPIIQPTLPQLTKKNAVGDGVQNFMKVKIYHIHHSPLMHRTSHTIKEGNQLGQALYGLANLC